MNKLTKVGIGLMALGIGVWAGWGAWRRTREVEPVNIPVAITAGRSVTTKFELNYDGLYLIEVASEKAEAEHLAAIRAEWSLRSSGEEAQKGSAAEAHSAPGGSTGPVKVIGEFNGQIGKNYELQVRFTEGTPQLAGNTTLRVAVSGLATENLQAASVLVFSMMFICELFGLILVAVGLWGNRGEAG